VLAEAFGTFWLVLGGCGSAALAANFPYISGSDIAPGNPFGLGFWAWPWPLASLW